MLALYIGESNLSVLSNNKYVIISRHRQRHENDYADLEFNSGWREEHAKALLELLLLEICKDGTISEGNVTDEVWLRIQNSLNNSMKCNFPIDFLKERLLHYKKLYSVLEETSSPIFNWDCKRNAVTIMEDGSNQVFTEIILYDKFSISS